MLTRKVFEQVAASVKKSVDKADKTKDLKLRDFAYDMAVELADYLRKRIRDSTGIGSSMLAGW